MQLQEGMHNAAAELEIQEGFTRFQEGMHTVENPNGNKSKIVTRSHFESEGILTSKPLSATNPHVGKLRNLRDFIDENAKDQYYAQRQNAMDHEHWDESDKHLVDSHDQVSHFSMHLDHAI